MVRVLGIDPGTYLMGVGIVESSGGGDLSVVHYTVLSAKRKDPVHLRLCHLFDETLNIIDSWQPDEVAIEEPFTGINKKSSMSIGHAQAIVMLAAAKCQLSISSYAPREVKQAVTDNGGSSKEQVEGMVKLLLGIDNLSGQFDSSDALAVAICHINASRSIELLEIS